MFRSKRMILLSSLAVLLVAYGAYAATVTVDNGGPTKEAAILAGASPDGSMFYHCDATASTPGVCEDVDGHARILVEKRDRIHVTVRTDDGRRHSHDFRLEGLPYLLWPAGVEMELEAPSESSTFTAWAAGEYRFVCELRGHESAGMWGTLVVR